MYVTDYLDHHPELDTTELLTQKDIDEIQALLSTK